MAHQVFISYSHIDSQIANALCQKLEDEGTKCWIAPRNIEPGKSWAGEIADALPKSKVVILILSESSNASSQVLREVEIAVHNKIAILPVRIEDIMPTGGMLYYLATMQWIDVKGDKIDSKISMISKRTRNILLDLEDREETNKEKLELLEKQQTKNGNNTKVKAEEELRLQKEKLIEKLRIERKLEAKELAKEKAEKKLFRQQEEEKLKKQQIELSEKKRFQREKLAKERAVAKKAYNEYKQQEKGKLKKKQKEILGSGQPLSIIKRMSTKALVAILSFVILIIAGLLTIYIINRNSSEDSQLTASAPILAPSPTKEPVTMVMPEDFGIDSSIIIEIPDIELKKAIIQTLDRSKTPIDGEIKVSDIFNLKALIIIHSYDERYLEHEYKKLIYETFTNIESLSGLEYAYNLNTLDVRNNSISDISSLSKIENLETLLISGNNINDISVLSNLSNLKELYLDIDTYNNNFDTVSKLVANGCNIQIREAN